jgi:hypothetical protein
MAENFTNEGLDRILGYAPGGAGTLDTTLYLAAITTAGTVEGTTALTGTTVPNRLTVWSTDYQTGGSGRGGGGEPTIGTGAYARKSMANTEWGAAATNGSGRRRTANQQSFAASTAAWSNPNVIGFGIVTASGAGAGVAYGFANFDDGSTVAVNAAGITLQVTPFWQHDI